MLAAIPQKTSQRALIVYTTSHLRQCIDVNATLYTRLVPVGIFTGGGASGQCAQILAEECAQC